jgi:hypothetical protein
MAPLCTGPFVRIGHDAKVKVVPATVALAKRRTWLSLGSFAAGYALLAIDNFFMPGGFNLLLAWLCLAAMALGLVGLLVSAWSWWRLRRRTGTSA